MRIRFEHDGRTFDYDANTLPLFEARLVKSLTGLNAGAFLKGLGEMDEEALAAMVYLAHRRSGDEDIEWDSLSTMDLLPLIESIGNHYVETEAEVAAAHFEGSQSDVDTLTDLTPDGSAQPGAAVDVDTQGGVAQPE